MIFHLLFFLRREHRAPRERNSDTHTTTVRFAVSPSTSPAPSRPRPRGARTPGTGRGRTASSPCPSRRKQGLGTPHDRPPSTMSLHGGRSRPRWSPWSPPTSLPQACPPVSLGPSLSGGPAVAPRDGPFAESLGQWLCQGLSKPGGQRPGKMKQTPPPALSGGIFRPPEMGAAGRVQAVSAPQELESGGSRWLTRKQGHL